MPEYRYARVSRRAFLGAVAGGSLVALVGCGTDDADVLAPVPASTQPRTGTVGTADAGSLPASAKLTVTFTYEASATSGDAGPRRPGGGMIRNPYIAVWVEDAAEELVATIALWHLQGGEDRWLSDLAAWFEASGGVETVSSATRAPGTYNVAWDCTDDAGARIPAGDYTLYIESAREHGPYQIIDQTVSLGATGGQWTLEPDGELVAASATFTAL